MAPAHEVFVSGDSASLYQVTQELKGLAEGNGPRFSVRGTTANRELAGTLHSLTGEQNGISTAALHSALFFPASVTGGEAGGVPFLPKERLLSPEEKSAAADAFAAVLAAGDFTSGPDVAAFEQALTDQLGVAETIATGSGTDAITIALRAVGVGADDEVIIPANSFAATENAVFACGAVPVLADVTLPDGNLDPAAVEARITPRTVAILPVHLYGKLADTAGLRAVADRHGLRIVEDACQAIGVTGVGRHADAAALSFNPYKNFGLCGKAGAVITDSPEVAARSRAFAYHGFVPGKKNVKSETYGLNSRIDNTMAAVGLAVLPWLGLRALRRTYLAQRYVDALRPHADSGAVLLPDFTPDHSWHLFPLILNSTEERDALLTRLRQDHGVETDVYYPVLTHLQQTPAREKLFGGAELPRTEQLHSRVLHLPLFAGQTPGEQDRVIEALHSALPAGR